MLCNLPELLPGRESGSSQDTFCSSAANEKCKEAQKAAQARALMKMKKVQSTFAESISTQFIADLAKKRDDNDDNLCIVCKCDCQ